MLILPPTWPPTHWARTGWTCSTLSYSLPGSRHSLLTGNGDVCIVPRYYCIIKRAGMLGTGGKPMFISFPIGA